jgi:hypothetical protein
MTLRRKHPREKMTGKHKVVDASVFNEVHSATQDLQVLVLPPHCVRATPKDPERCPAVLAAKEQHGFESFVVHRTVAYGRKPGETGYVRWINETHTYHWICQLDDGNYKDVPEAGLLLRFKAPNGVRRIEYVQSEEFKAQRRASYQRRKGKKRRPYRLPDPKTLAGARNRFGYYTEPDG